MVNKPLDTEGVDLTLLEEMTEEQAYDYLRCKYGRDAELIIEEVRKRTDQNLH